jgi:hypothetical protein
MKCYNCDYYKSGYMYNACALTESEYFREPDNCTLVNDDGSINRNDPYFAQEVTP